VRQQHGRSQTHNPPNERGELIAEARHPHQRPRKRRTDRRQVPPRRAHGAPARYRRHRRRRHADHNWERNEHRRAAANGGEARLVHPHGRKAIGNRRARRPKRRRVRVEGGGSDNGRRRIHAEADEQRRGERNGGAKARGAGNDVAPRPADERQLRDGVPPREAVEGGEEVREGARRREYLKEEGRGGKDGQGRRRVEHPKRRRRGHNRGGGPKVGEAEEEHRRSGDGHGVVRGHPRAAERHAEEGDDGGDGDDDVATFAPRADGHARCGRAGGGGDHGGGGGGGDATDGGGWRADRAAAAHARHTPRARVGVRPPATNTAGARSAAAPTRRPAPPTPPRARVGVPAGGRTAPRAR